jgi:hypothetical protein
MKKNYAKITYNNCDSVDYGYTICELQDINENLFPVEIDFKDNEENSFKQIEFALPSIKIELVKLSDWQFSKWFKEHVEKDA